MSHVDREKYDLMDPAICASAYQNEYFMHNYTIINRNLWISKKNGSTEKFIYILIVE